MDPVDTQHPDPEPDPMDRCDCNIPYLEGAGQHSPGCNVFRCEACGMVEPNHADECPAVAGPGKPLTAPAQHPDPVREALTDLVDAVVLNINKDEMAVELEKARAALADPSLGRVEPDVFPHDTDAPDLIGPNFRSGIRSVLLSLDSGNSTLKQAETEAFGMIDALVSPARVEQVGEAGERDG